jgi:hypothetical protein
MHRSLAQYSAPVSFVHALSWADFIITMVGLKVFGTHRDYPRWWGIVTGGLEIVSAAMIALPCSRIVGLALGAAIIAAAILTVLRHRDFSHLVPLGVFAALIALATALP